MSRHGADLRRFRPRTGGTRAPAAQSPITTAVEAQSSSCSFAALLDVLGIVGIIAVVRWPLLPGLAHRAALGRQGPVAFLTVAQDLDHHGLPIGRRRDVRVHFAADQRSLVVGRRSLVRSNPAVWTVKSKSEVSRRRLVYVLRPADRGGDIALLAVRVPRDSKVVARLDVLLDLTGDEATMRRERERYRAEQELGRGRYGSFRQSRNAATGSASRSRLMRNASWPCGESISA